MTAEYSGRLGAMCCPLCGRQSKPSRRHRDGSRLCPGGAWWKAARLVDSRPGHGRAKGARPAGACARSTVETAWPVRPHRAAALRRPGGACAAARPTRSIIAGMGGELVIHILEAGPAGCGPRLRSQCVLSPQSELHKAFRLVRYLRANGFAAEEREPWCSDEGKYYTVMRCALEGSGRDDPEPECCAADAGSGPWAGGMSGTGLGRRPAMRRTVPINLPVRIDDLYGAFGLLRMKHPVLKEHLQKSAKRPSPCAEPSPPPTPTAPGPGGERSRGSSGRIKEAEDEMQGDH